MVSLAYIWRFILDGFGILASLQRKFTLGLAHVALSWAGFLCSSTFEHLALLLHLHIRGVPL